MVPIKRPAVGHDLRPQVTSPSPKPIYRCLAFEIIGPSVTLVDTRHKAVLGLRRWRKGVRRGLLLGTVGIAAVLGTGCGSSEPSGLAESSVASESETSSDPGQPEEVDSAGDDETGDDASTASDQENSVDVAPPAASDEGSVGAEGSIVAALEDGIFRITADGTTDPVNLSAALDDHSLGSDSWMGVSRNGDWLIMDTERFGCEDWACLAIAPSDLSEVTLVEVEGEPVHPQDWGVVGDDGTLVVITTDEGANGLDLAVLRQDGDSWSVATSITDDSPHAYNARGRLTPDGSSVVFDCGPTQYGQEGTGVCQVSLDGGEVESLVRPEEGPEATASNLARSGNLGADGSLVFEADWGGSERLWRRDSGGEITLHSGLENDNSPCLLPDGSVASLWLQRDGNTGGVHELKIHAADGAVYEVPLPNIDVQDFGIHCGG